MINFSKAGAWFLVFLQAVFATVFIYFLSSAPFVANLSFSYAPLSYQILVFIQIGITFLLLATTLVNFRLTGIVLLAALQIICPLIFFTDLTKNPYFTQITFFNIWVVILYAALFFEGLVQKKWTLPKTAIDWPLFLFFVCGLLSWTISYFGHPARFASSSLTEGIKIVQFYILNVAGIFYLSRMVPSSYNKNFMLITFGVAFVAAAYGLMQFYGLETIWTLDIQQFGNRPISTFGNPNFLSTYILLVLPPVFIYLLHGKNTYQFIVRSFVFGVLILGLFSTMTRSTWVGTIFAFTLLFCINPGRSFVLKYKKQILILFSIAVFSGVFFLQNKQGGYKNIWQRITEIKDVKKTEGYAPWHQRILIWSCAWQMQKDHPLTGKGWGLFESFYPFYQGQNLYIPRLNRFRTHANNAHNELLEVWSQTGFLGTGVYIWLWAALLFAGYKLTRSPSKKKNENFSENQLLRWALTCAAFGVGVDNLLGNVSLHFTIPSLLFWWQAGTLLKPENSENNFILPTKKVHGLLSAVCLIGLLLFFAVLSFRRELGEIYYFYASKYSKNNQTIDLAKNNLEESWRWYKKEVYTNYELGNVYLRLSQSPNITEQEKKMWNNKSFWAYQEALNSITGYDEIYSNIGVVQQKSLDKVDLNLPVKVTNPDGKEVLIQADADAVTHLKFALAINPLNKEAYGILISFYLSDVQKFKKPAIETLQRATWFFPQEQNFWINRAFLEVNLNQYDNAYNSLIRSLKIDPRSGITIANMKNLLQKMQKTNDPIVYVLDTVSNLNQLVAQKNWTLLEDRLKRCRTIFPDCFYFEFLLGGVYLQQNRFDLAEQAYARAYQIDSQNIDNLQQLAALYLQNNKPEQARPLYQTILANNPDDAKAKAYFSTH